MTTLTVVNPPTAVTTGLSVILTSGIMDGAGGTLSISSITDSQGNTYAQDVTTGAGTSSSPRTDIWSAHNAKALLAGDTITIAFSGLINASWEFHASEYSGLLHSLPLDQTATAGPTTSSSLSSGPTGTTTVANEVLIGAMTIVGGGPTWTPGAGWTLDFVQVPGLLGVSLFSEYQIVSATGAYTATATTSQTRTWTAAIATYKTASAAAPFIGVAKLSNPKHTLVSFIGVAAINAINRVKTKLIGVANLTPTGRTTARGQAKLIGVAVLRSRLIYGLFVRLGHILGLINAINLHRGTDVPNRVTQLEEDFRLPPPYRNLIDGIYNGLATYQKGSAASFISQLDGLADALVINEMNDNDGLPNLTLATALVDLVNDMRTDAESVKACTVTATVVANPLNVGNAAVVLSTLDGFGRTLENIFPEKISVTCTVDGQASGTSGSETLSALGQIAQSNELSWDWAKGSGCKTNLTVVSETSSRNLVTDGAFANWSGTPPVPTNWLAGVGTMGTNIVQESVAPYKGTFAIKMIGDGSTLLSFYQALKTKQFVQETVYAICCWIRVNGIPAAGVLELALTDGATPATWVNTINDRGVANKFSIDLTTLAVPNVYTPFCGVIQTGVKMPAAPNIVYRLTTALSTGRHLSIDTVALVPMTQLYPGGPFVSVHAGNMPLIKNDVYTITCTNDFGGATAATNWQNCFERLFGMRQIGLVLPSSATPTVNNNLIV